MRSCAVRMLVASCLAIAMAWGQSASYGDTELTDRSVRESIDRAKRFLLSAQQPDGSWHIAPKSGETHAIAGTSFTLMALLNAGMTPRDKPIERGLAWLRDPRRNPGMTHEVALMIEALAAAKEGRRDIPLLTELVGRLERGETKGANDGSWTFAGDEAADGAGHSRAHFAAIALREAQHLGVPVPPEVWIRARAHWERRQNPDGGWGSQGADHSSGGLTAAGVAYVVVTDSVLRSERIELQADGTPLCCDEPPSDPIVDRACRWLGQHFTVGTNPGSSTGHLYYLYCLERVGRLTGRRFFTDSKGNSRDWYREGTESLLAQQDLASGSWVGQPAVFEDDPVLATAYALHFLSKGMTPIAINKLHWGNPATPAAAQSGHGNLHPDDARHLTQFVSRLEKWPAHIGWQSVDIERASVDDLLQAPVLLLHGRDAPQFATEEIERIKDYIAHGGLVFAVRGCDSSAFDEGFRELVRRMYPSREAELKRLDVNHPVYRSEFPLLSAETGEPLIELWGVDVGCRTGMIYSPDDLSCLWAKWTSHTMPHRPEKLEAQVTQALRVGTNVLAYATGRELLSKTARREWTRPDQSLDRLERDHLTVARLQYSGDWNAAPGALPRLLAAVKTTAGTATGTRPRNLPATDPNLFRYPVLFMHGKHEFEFSADELRSLKDYLDRGGVLIADACCSGTGFDTSFRSLMKQLYPARPLARIPPRHEILSKATGFDIEHVQCRLRDKATGQLEAGDIEPILEAIELDGRFSVLYSRYDLSCAIDRQAPAVCEGYEPEDALRIGVNLVLYSLH